MAATVGTVTVAFAPARPEHAWIGRCRDRRAGRRCARHFPLKYGDSERRRCDQSVADESAFRRRHQNIADRIPTECVTAPDDVSRAVQNNQKGCVVPASYCCRRANGHMASAECDSPAAWNVLTK